MHLNKYKNSWVYFISIILLHFLLDVMLVHFGLSIFSLFYLNLIFFLMIEDMLVPLNATENKRKSRESMKNVSLVEHLKKQLNSCQKPKESTEKSVHIFICFFIFSIPILVPLPISLVTVTDFILIPSCLFYSFYYFTIVMHFILGILLYVLLYTVLRFLIDAIYFYDTYR